MPNVLGMDPRPLTSMVAETLRSRVDAVASQIHAVAKAVCYFASPIAAISASSSWSSAPFKLN